MTTDLNTKLYLSAMDAIQRGPAPRHYAAEPAADYHVECFKKLCERDAAVREQMAEREEEPAGEIDAEQFFLEQQCPSDATFR